MRILPLFVLVAWYADNVEPVAGELYRRPAKNYKESVAIFAKESFKVIAQNRTGNFIYSPFGASTLLTMAAFAADNRTARETRASLALPRDDVETSKEIMTILNNLNRIQAHEVRVTSKIFSPELYQPKQDFIHMTEWIFKSRFQEVDFYRLYSAIRDINDWSSAQTDGQVKEIIDSSLIHKQTELLLLTAGYVESKWKLPFKSHRTMLSSFYVNNDKVWTISTMSVSGYFRSGELNGFDASFVELPFADTPPGGAVSMYIILPNDRNGLPNLLKHFHEIDMFTLMGATSRSINVYLPKFKFASSLSLREPLETLGFQNMFSLGANFSGITDNCLLYVSNVIQKIQINVHEDDNPTDFYSGLDPRHREFLEEFRVDHPFVCVIMKPDGIPLFIAVVNEPE